MFLYGKEKKDEDIKKHVLGYVASIKNAPHDRYAAIRSLLPRHKMVLDYGCGWGHYSIALAELGNNVTALDLSENEISICKLVWGEFPNIEWKVGDIMSLANAAYDCILSVAVIEHVHNPGMYLAQINRVLKTGGELIIVLPNIMTPRQLAAILSKDLGKILYQENERVLNQYDKAHDHIQAWDAIHFVRLVGSIGFKLDKYIPAEGTPLPPVRFLPHYVFLSNKRLENLSYSMIFRFIKVRDRSINVNE